MILVKEEFLTEEKTIRAMRAGGPGVIVMWLALKGYAARKNSGGFIPDEAIDDLQGAPRRPRVLLNALVECGLKKPDGTRGAGLVDKVDHGWQLHDYDDHSTNQTDEELRREKARIKKQEQRAKKAEELAMLQSRRGDRTGTERGQSEGHDWDSPGDEPEDVSRVHSRAAGPAPARTRAPDPAPVRARAGSQPSPAQPSRTDVDPSASPPAKDLPGSARVASNDPRAGWLARSVVRDRKPGEAPLPRHDPLNERFAWKLWSPSQQILDWAREKALPDAKFDSALADLRNKEWARGLYDVEYWDQRAIAFLEQAIARHHEPPGLREHRRNGGRGDPGSGADGGLTAEEQARLASIGRTA